MKRLIAVSFLAALSIGWADTMTLRTGRVVTGSYLGGDSRQIKMAVGDRIETFSIADVTRIEFGSLSSNTASLPTAEMPPAPAPPPPPAAYAPAAPAPAPLPPEAPDRRELRTDRTPPASNSAYRGTEIPAGTSLTIRLIDPVDSRIDRLGQTYHASLDEPVMINGDVVVPRGVDVVAKLVDDKQAGRATGTTVLTLDLESITIDGRVVPIATEEITRASGSRTKKTGLAAGGLGVLGAVIGGIAGGGKGAAIGAVTGAGVGAGGSVLMKGEQVKIPSETRLTFTLEQPLKI